MSEFLLARYAENLFWLGRYIERAENLARILDVNETFSRDSHGGQNWLSIVQLHSDEAAFFERHAAATDEAVVRFYVSDATNATSLVSTIRNARENARTLRPLISTEMWAQLNMFYNRVAGLRDSELVAGQLSTTCAFIKEACQTHTGITEGTFYRDQGWYFYQLGRQIERADQTTRLLDIKYHLLLPKPTDVGSPIDASQWNALLRSAAGYHAYRRVHSSGGITPGRVTGFLLLNPSFPRSVYLCVREADALLNELKLRYSLRGGNDAAEELGRLRSVLEMLPVREILAEGLHEFLDLLQGQLILVTRALTESFFAREEPPRSPVAGLPMASECPS